MGESPSDLHHPISPTCSVPPMLMQIAVLGGSTARAKPQTAKISKWFVIHQASLSEVGQTIGLRARA